MAKLAVEATAAKAAMARVLANFEFMVNPKKWLIDRSNGLGNPIGLCFSVNTCQAVQFIELYRYVSW